MLILILISVWYNISVDQENHLTKGKAVMICKVNGLKKFFCLCSEILKTVTPLDAMLEHGI